MAAIRCPHCGLQNYADDLSYPRCGQCHEDLARCDVCRHFSQGVCAHPTSAARFTPDLEAAKTCPTFHSRHEVKDGRLLSRLSAPMWVVLLLVLIIGSLTAVAWIIDPYGRYFIGSPMTVTATMPDQVLVNRPFSVYLYLRNQLPVAGSRVFVEIDGRYLNTAMLVKSTPQPLQMSLGTERIVLEYPGIAPNGRRVIQLHFIQVTEGSAPFVVRIYAPANHLIAEMTHTITATGVITTPRGEGGI